jgi:hypothetical protein
MAAYRTPASSPREGTASTFAALESVIRNYGRFCELYTDRGSHFCQSGPAGELAEQQEGQVSQSLRALGIRQIRAIHLTLADASNAPSAPSKAGCRRNSGVTALPTILRPIAISSSSLSPTSIQLHGQAIPTGKRLRQTGGDRIGTGVIEQA